jgi:RNA polymerase sigma factor (sigma-70 family)
MIDIESPIKIQNHQLLEREKQQVEKKPCKLNVCKAFFMGLTNHLLKFGVYDLSSVICVNIKLKYIMEATFNSLIDANQQFLKTLAYKLTKNRNEAEELYQETVLKLLLNRDRFDMNTNFRHWSQFIMRNNFINHYRQHERRQTFSTDTNDSMFANLCGGVQCNQSISNLNMEYLQGVIGELDERYRTPLELHLNGTKYQEMVEILDQDIAYLRTQVYLAKKMLRDRLRSFYYEIAA